MKERIESVIDEQITNLQNLKESDYVETMESIIGKIVDCIKNGNKVLIAGNGGSAADSQHMAAELVGRFLLERRGYPAIALTTDTSALTSIGNDYSFDVIFSRQVEALGNEGDIFIGISTSGNSKNIIEAVNKAHEKKMFVIGFLGRDGGKLKDMCDIDLTFNYKETARVQEHHLMSYHLICDLVEQKLVETE